MRCRRGPIRFAGLGEKIAASLDVDDAILDGEIVAADETGRPQFYDLLRNARLPTYVAFDLIWLNGGDLRRLPLTERRRRLQDILPKVSAIISEGLSDRNLFVEGQLRPFARRMRGRNSTRPDRAETPSRRS